MSVLAVYATEDAEIFYSEIAVAFWEEKLEHYYKHDHEAFVGVLNDFINSGEVERKGGRLFSDIPADVVARAKRVVIVTTWI